MNTSHAEACGTGDTYQFPAISDSPRRGCFSMPAFVHAYIGFIGHALLMLFTHTQLYHAAKLPGFCRVTSEYRLLSRCTDYMHLPRSKFGACLAAGVKPRDP